MAPEKKAEAMKTIEAYRLKKDFPQNSTSRKVWSLFPLKPKSNETMRQPSAQTYDMSTPPPPAPGLPGPLQRSDFPLPNLRAPSRKEERAIAQKNQPQTNVAKALANAHSLGLHLVWDLPEGKSSITTSTKLVSSSMQLGSDMESKVQENGARFLKSRPPSEAGTESSWKMDGHRWLNERSLSEPAGDPGTGMSAEKLTRTQQKEQDTDLLTPPSRTSRRGRSPPSSRTPDLSRSSVP